MQPLDFEFLKDRYDFELERKDKITSAIGLPVAILTALGGLMVAMASSFAYDRLRLKVIFILALGLGAVSFGFCLFWLSKAYRGSTYTYLPKLADLEGALEEWREFYRYARQGGADEDFFAHEFRKRIIEAADRNTESNDVRSAFLDRANAMISALVLLVAVAGIVYLFNQILWK